MKNLIMTFAIVSKLVSGCGDGASPSGIPMLPEQQTTEQVDEKTNKDKKSEGSEIVSETKDSPVAVARAATAEQPAAAPDGLATLPGATVSESAIPAGDTGSGSGALKLTDSSCQDAAVSEVKVGVRFMKCDGSWAEGTMAAETVTVQVAVPGPTVTLTPTPIPNCTSNRQVGCVTTSAYESADLSSLGGANVRQGVVIAGTTGTMSPGVESHTDCTANRQVGCITTATFKSADFTSIVPGKLKAGSWVAGIMGEYPSATYPLKDSTATSDLDLSSFNTKLASAAAFEWFDSSGTRHSNNGSASFTAANVLTGVTLFGVTGAMSPGEQPNAWDIRYGVAINGITGLSKMSCRSDTTDVALKCDYAGWDPHADVEGHTAKTDRISGLMWVSMVGNAGSTKAWANTYCTNLANSTGEAWRVPALEEINSAFVHRIDYVFSLYNVPGNRIWSSSSYQAAGKTEASVLLDSVSTSATAFCVKYRASY
jgi:hypothetical protein